MNTDKLNIIGIGKSVIVGPKTYTIDEVYDVVKDHLFDSRTKNKKTKKGRVVTRSSPQRVELDGDMVKANSQRLQLFYTKGFKCVTCGTEGKFFIKCKNPSEKVFHLELIGQKLDGQYVLMTKDHILPKSKGGKDVLENYQTMCTECNHNKSNNLEIYITGTRDELIAANKVLFKENMELKREIEKLKNKLDI